MLHAEDLFFSYSVHCCGHQQGCVTDSPDCCGEDYIIRNLSVRIKKGAVTTLLGANGCGKSTLLKLFTKNLKPQSGKICLMGEDIQNISIKDFAKQVAVVSQKNSVPDDLTVERLVMYGRLPYSSFFRLGADKEGKKYVDRALELTDLTELRGRPMGTLSGGQKQRAFIAMALAQNTEVLFLDEPTTFLDVRYQVEILQLIRCLNREQGMTIIMVLHDINQALSYSDEVIGMCGGKVAFQGNPEDVITRENIREIYGVELPVIRNEGRVFVPAVGDSKPKDAKNSVMERASVYTHREEKNENKEMFEKKTPKKARSKFMQGIFVILGIVCVVLATIGVVLPVLPTTPFLLLAALCFARSSERLEHWFKGTKLYKSHLETFARNEGMTWDAKLRILGTVTVIIAPAIFFMQRSYLVKGSKGALFGAVTMGIVWVVHVIAFLFFIKTCSKERAAEIAALREAKEHMGKEGDMHDVQ